MLVVVVVLVVAGTVHSFLDRDKCSDVVVVPRTFNFVPRFSSFDYVLFILCHTLLFTI